MKNICLEELKPTMIKHAVFSFGALIVATLLTGCASTTKQITPEISRQVVTGQNRTEVNAILGEPNRTRSSSSGKIVDTHQQSELLYSTSSASDRVRDLRLRTLSVLYNPNGKVEMTYFYESHTPAVYYSRSTYIGRMINSEEVARIKVGTTTQQELENWFKKPTSAILHPSGGRELNWYGRETGTSFTSPVQNRRLLVWGDEEGIVRDMNFTNESRDKN